MCTLLTQIKKLADNEGITVGALEKAIGASKGVLSRAINNGTDIQSKWLSLIVENYPLYNLDWLLTGKGEMLKSIPEKPHTTTLMGEGTPYFDVDFIGGFNEIFNDQTSKPNCNIVVPGFEKATLWCNVTGRSMEPKINHGDIIALRECTVEDIQYGEIYAIVLDTLRTIKILRRGSTPDTLLYVPINQPDYEPQEFPLARILRIFEVLGSIAKFF